MASMDIFNQNAFSMVQLVHAMEKIPFRPTRMAQLGLFTPRRVRTTFVSVEERDGVLNIIPTTQRGEPLPQRTTEKRRIRNFNTVRIAKGDRIMASEVQDIRQFGSETELMQVMDEVARRLDGDTGLLREVEMTWEHMMLGAIQGKVMDADGTTVLWNWFTAFDVPEPDEIAFDFANTSGDGGIRKKTNQVVRTMMRASKGVWVEGQTRVYALCGDNFWDDLTQHPEVRQTYLNTVQAQQLRNDKLPYEQFTYGGITWENYRGTDDGSTVAVPTDKARFFPVGAPGAFQVGWSPAEFAPFVNTLGRPVYPIIVPDRDRQAWVDIEVYSYPLFMATRPGMLLSGRRGA